MEEREQQEGEPRAVPTVSAVRSDGSLVELLCSADLRETRLAAGVGGAVTLYDSIDEGDVRLVPVSSRNNLIRHGVVLLPEEAKPFESIAALLNAIEAYIVRYVDLSPDFVKIASAYVLLSWVYDAVNELPYLRFRGDYGSGKTRALLVLGSITYKPLFASGASTISPIFHALDLFRGTLVVDESDFRMSDERAELVKIMNNGNVRGFPVLRSQATPAKTYDPRAFHVYGPKIVAMRHAFDDPALESRFLTEEMGVRPLRRGIPLNLPDRQRDEARELRNQLLAYRFAYRAKTRIDLAAYDATLSARTNQIIAPLLSVIEDEAVRQSIRDRMRSSEELVRTERSQSPEGHALQAVLSLMAECANPFIPIGDIAAEFARRFGHEYDRPITARYVGHLLRARLRLPTWKRHGTFVLGTSDTEHLALLRERYGFASSDQARHPAALPLRGE
jgi:hypothetical protein